MGQKTVENAGKAFWNQFELPLCSDAKPSSNDGQEEDGKTGSKDKAANDREKAYKEKRAKREAEQKARDGGLLKISEGLKGKDLYELLGVEASVSSEDIKKAYKKMALTHHPDKMKDPTEEQKQHFILIQEATDILSDPVKRRRFESTLKFDDTIPSDLRKGYADNFFEVFAPVFKRNARWSSQPRVPELGDAETPIEKVKSFYEFWQNFDSWRDPMAMAEAEEVELHNLEEAECREEKRYMERENAKIARKIKQGERERIADLVKIAEKHDPRMIAHRAELTAGKEAAKAQKLAAEEAERIRLESEAKEAAEAAEAKRLAEEERRMAEKKGKEETKNALKSARQRVRNLHKNAEAMVRRAVHIDQLQEVCLALGTEELGKLATQLEDTLAKESEDYSATIELLHNEIKKTGGTPIEDDSVQLKPDVDSESTATPDDSCNEAPPTPGSPEKVRRVPTSEELEAKRVEAEAKEAAERVLKEKKAEEQRKKREQKKRDDEKKAAAANRAEAAQRAKERKAQEKAATKDVKQEEAPACITPKAQKTSQDTGIAKNVILVVIEESVVFSSPTSSDEISTISAGSFLVASGPPVEVDGYDMVPLQPTGAVELRTVTKMNAPEASIELEDEAVPEVVPVKTQSTAKPGKLQVQEEDLDALLDEFGLVPQPVAKSPKKKGKK